MVTTRDIEREIRQLYSTLLGRSPGEKELATWTRVARDSELSFHDLFDKLIHSVEYRRRTRVVPSHPLGHFYSPVVDTEELKTHFAPDRTLPIESLPGLGVTDADMQEQFDRLRPHIGAHHFPKDMVERQRYPWDTGMGFYPLGDATVLAAMIAHKRPRRIIEVGSGFSTAVMLDTVEREELGTTITCVEPYPARLRSIMTPADAERVSIHECPVQCTDPAMYDALASDDILFIDSTHVLKTGSDVCFELFEILPRLRPGVLVHFHDIHYPFEYPDGWIFKRKRSWNEVYAVHAFLMFNSAFRIIYFNNYVATRNPEQLSEAYGAPVLNPGGGLWIERVA